ncbi:hypothetical protein [Micromonospora craniellae]|uniref:hypothetical protein n=1 Tax=Micromonospora craniellae TaxID=2294034 RepID=UPI001CC734A4|nr:hypothetical protein [Micromonospora craniellae]
MPVIEVTNLHKRYGETVAVQLQESQLPDRLRGAEALELYASFYRRPADRSS